MADFCSNGDVAFDKEMYDKYGDSAKQNGTVVGITPGIVCQGFVDDRSLCQRVEISALHRIF